MKNPWNDMIPLLPLQVFMSLISVQGKLCVFAPCFVFYIISLHAAWILHQAPPKLLRFLICIELIVALVSTIPRVSPPRLRIYPFHAEKKVLMLHGTEFRSRLGMATNTPSSVYKPLHKYRILRVSKSPHLYELCTTLSVVAQHLSFCTVSSFTKRPACLEHRQVWLPTSSRSSNSAIPIFVRYAFFFACLSSWCLSRKGLVIPLNTKPGCPLL
ncbi:hypothetical protein GW17_00060942 [Ensete ventricosum]|nr:hypothetical protein GW17_00060942 [Ensete ventricosum]